VSRRTRRTLHRPRARSSRPAQSVPPALFVRIKPKKAGEAELRVDSLVLLGASLAEMGETGQAREQLSLALDLARQIGYEAGEINASVQLRVLEGDSSEGAS